MKLSRWFLGFPVVEADPPRQALRVSRYLEEVELTSEEGTVRVPKHHVRFSIWNEDRCIAAVSLPEDEAAELAEFLLSRGKLAEPPASERPARA